MYKWRKHVMWACVFWGFPVISTTDISPTDISPTDISPTDNSPTPFPLPQFFVYDYNSACG